MIADFVTSCQDSSFGFPLHLRYSLFPLPSIFPLLSSDGIWKKATTPAPGLMRAVDEKWVEEKDEEQGLGNGLGETRKQLENLFEAVEPAAEEEEEEKGVEVEEHKTGAENMEEEELKEAEEEEEEAEEEEAGEAEESSHSYSLKRKSVRDSSFDLHGK